MEAQSEPGHGNSPAAWTAVVIMLVGFAGGTLAFWLDIAWLVWVAAGVVPMFVNMISFLVLATALLFTPRYLLLDLSGVERQCTVAAAETGSVTSTRTGKRGPASHLTLDCPDGRYEIRGARQAPETGSTGRKEKRRSRVIQGSERS